MNQQITFSNEIKLTDALFQKITQFLQYLTNTTISSSDTVTLSELKQLWDSIHMQAQMLSIDIDTIHSTLSSILENQRMDQLPTLIPFMQTLQKIVQKKYSKLLRDEDQWSHLLLTDYFETRSKKRALLAYILYPFLFPKSSTHTNQQESIALAKVLSNHGYSVDLCSHTYQKRIPPNSYDLIIGYGNAIDQLSETSENEPIYYYLTESSPYYSNPAECKRHLHFWQRNHAQLPLERHSSHFLSLQPLMNARGALCIGNQITANTYRNLFQSIYPINATGFQLSLSSADFVSFDAKDFLWYGGYGPIHKGLDLLIEAFRQLPTLRLHIVGHVDQDFFGFYQDDFERAPNLFYYDFLHKDDPVFLEVCRKCSFCLSPSCSEGQSTSVLTAMFGGVIPVCTPQNGIDLSLCGGYTIEDCTVEGLVSFISSLSKTSEKDILIHKQMCYDYVLKNHTLQAYQKQMEALLSSL